MGGKKKRRRKQKREINKRKKEEIKLKWGKNKGNKSWMKEAMKERKRNIGRIEEWKENEMCERRRQGKEGRNENYNKTSGRKGDN